MKRLGWAGLGWAGLGWAGLGWAGLGWCEVWVANHGLMPGKGGGEKIKFHGKSSFHLG